MASGHTSERLWTDNYGLPPNNHIEFSESEWNLSPVISRRKTSSHAYADSTQYFPRYSRSMRSRLPTRHREFLPFNNKQSSEEGAIPKRPYYLYDCNFRLKNLPNRGNYYNENRMRLTHSSPYNVRGRFNQQCFQADGGDFSLQNNLNESIFHRNHPRAENLMQRNSQYSEMQNFANFNMHQNSWDKSTIRIASDPSHNRISPIHRSQLQNTRPLTNICDEIISTPVMGAEISRIAPPAQSLSNVHTGNQTIVDNSLTITNVTEGTNQSFADSQMKNMENETFPKELEDALNSMDETALSVYFLNNLYPASKAEDPIHELTSYNQSILPNNHNMLDEVPTNSLEPQISAFQISTDFNSDGKTTEAYSEPGNKKDIDMNKYFDINTVVAANLANGSSEECVSNPSSDNMHVNYSESQHNSNENESISSRTLDVSDKENNNDSEKRYPVFNQNCSYDDKSNSSAEQKLIFHAPIINISQQNQISAGNSPVGFNSRKLFDDSNLGDFDSTLCPYLTKSVMKLLCSLKKSPPTRSIPVHSNSTVKYDEQDICLETAESSTLDIKENDKSTHLNSMALSSIEGNFRESDFMYSNVLDSQVLSSHIETSLSSLTNYVLEEPTEGSSKHKDDIFESNDIKYSSVNVIPEENLKRLRKKSNKTKKKNERKRGSSMRMRISALFKPHLTTEKSIYPSIKLLDNIFESDTDEYSPAFGAEVKENLKYSKNKEKKIKKKKWKDKKRLISVNRHSTPSLISKVSCSDKLNCVDGRLNINTFSQNLKKLYCNAASQTSCTELNVSCVSSVSKTDAQTQWNSTDLNFKKITENFEQEHKGTQTPRQQRYNKRVCKQNNIVKEKRTTEIKCKDNKCTWNLRTRRSVSETNNANVERGDGIPKENQFEINSVTYAINNIEKISSAKEIIHSRKKAQNPSNNTKMLLKTKNRSSWANRNEAARNKQFNSQNFLKEEAKNASLQSKKAHITLTNTTKNLLNFNQRKTRQWKSDQELPSWNNINTMPSISALSEKKSTAVKRKRTKTSRRLTRNRKPKQ